MFFSPQLRGKATINKNVAILRLPKRGEDVKPGTKCHVAGWGLIHNDKLSQPDTLREVNVTVLDRKTCNGPKYYGHDPVITRDMICAGEPRGGKDTCDVSGRRPRPWAVGFRFAEIEEATPRSALSPRLGPSLRSVLSWLWLSRRWFFSKKGGWAANAWVDCDIFWILC